MRRTTPLLAIGLAALAAAAQAQAPAASSAPAGPPPFAQVRGPVASLDGTALTVTQAGAPVPITLSADWKVTLLKKVGVSTIQPGSFIGTTEVEKPDGTGVSREVHVFAPGVKAGQGHFPMPNSGGAMMTNGDVTGVVKGAKGQELDIAYPGGKVHVFVGPDVPVVAFTDGDRSMVKPGTPVLVFAVRGKDGALGAQGVLVGENGAPPPL